MFQFEVSYRLNSECNWQSSLIVAEDQESALDDLLESVIIIYQLNSKLASNVEVKVIC